MFKRAIVHLVSSIAIATYLMGYGFAIAAENRPNIVFLMADDEFSHISSSLIKQITPLADDGKLGRFVPPAVVTAISMPFTFSIAHGIAFGFITYVATKLLAGRSKDLSPMVVLIAVLFVLKFAFL